MDTSLVSTDNINNPRMMNAIYNLFPTRALAALGPRNLTGGHSTTTVQHPIASGP
jgi:hypothetical protein